MSAMNQDETLLSSISLKNRDLCEIVFKSSLKSVDNKFRDLEKYLTDLTNCPGSNINQLKVEMRNFRKSFLFKWDKCGRHKNRFFEMEKSWLVLNSHFTLYQKSKGGRPVKCFNECSDRKKTAEIRRVYSSDELTYAAQMSLRASGKHSEAKKIKDLASPNTSTENTSPVNRMLTNDQALSLLVDAQLSRNQYNIIRNYAKDVFPSYKNVQKAKKQCIPQGTTTTEVESEVPLQSLLDHTANRLMTVLKDALSDSTIVKLTLISKWGFDGSSGHTQYMQNFSSDSSDDKYIFLSSLVPLRLIAQKIDGQTFVLWQNPLPSSPRFCRPIKLQYKKESTELTASITGVDKTLIHRLYIILQTISSGFKVDSNKFNKFCLDTAELYVSLNPWHPMTTTMHKILIHGSEIISNCLLPIGQLSEEAQESRNKDFKIYRERFSRKTSRENNLKDTFHRLLISSDPLITNFRTCQVVKRRPFDPEVIDMLLQEDLIAFPIESDASDADNE